MIFFRAHSATRCFRAARDIAECRVVLSLLCGRNLLDASCACPAQRLLYAYYPCGSLRWYDESCPTTRQDYNAKKKVSGRSAESDSCRRYLLRCHGSKKIRRVVRKCDKMTVFFFHVLCSAASRWGHTVNLSEERSTRKWRISWSKRDGHTPASARRRNSLPSASRCTPFALSAFFLALQTGPREGMALHIFILLRHLQFLQGPFARYL